MCAEKVWLELTCWFVGVKGLRLEGVWDYFGTGVWGTCLDWLIDLEYDLCALCTGLHVDIFIDIRSYYLTQKILFLSLSTELLA